jgi:hypothetical protein
LAVVPQRRRRDDDRFDHGTGHDDHPRRRQRDSQKDAGSVLECLRAVVRQMWQGCHELCPRGELRTNHTDPAALTCPVWTPTGFVDSRSSMTVYETGRGLEGV